METPTAEEAQRDQQLQKELDELLQERADIISGKGKEVQAGLKALEEELAMRKAVAHDARTLQLAALQKNFEAEKKAAWDEYRIRKRRFAEQLLKTNAERRKRLESLRLASLAKKRKRPRSSLVRVGKRRSALGTRLLEDLEKRGVLPVRLNMDEVNSDVGAILANVDAAKAANTKDRNDGLLPSKNGEKVQSLRGQLYYFDQVLRLGDVVAVYSNKQGPARYKGEIVEVNLKDIRLQEPRDNVHRIYVAHLRNERVRLKKLS